MHFGLVVVPAMEGIAAVSIMVGQNLDVVVIAISALAATQIPAAIAGFVALTAGMSASAVATGGVYYRPNCCTRGPNRSGRAYRG